MITETERKMLNDILLWVKIQYASGFMDRAEYLDTVKQLRWERRQ